MMRGERHEHDQPRGEPIGTEPRTDPYENPAAYAGRGSGIASSRLALAALVAGAVGIAYAPVFVRLSELGPTATAFWRLALPGLWLWMELANRRGAVPARRPSSRRTS
jgi:hypothetical protein